MMFASGTRIGVYDIVSLLGEGGMGAVYRARDTKLNRDVALKVLLPAVANDPDRLARFSREAQVLASLNHPHIGAIHGLEESDGAIALVMELVEGEDLSQRIARGAIPLDEALPIARQIAEALEAAHEQGIVHRDLKPANIKVRPDGTVKVLDFGLAKAMEAPGSGLQTPGQAVTQSPTITTPAMTQAGMILGTAAYMAPEQAKGRPVDKRADIWAFGAVLYEMLTGRRVFPGEDITDTIVAVVSKEPDWSALPEQTPAVIRKLLRRCLEKDRKRRLADAADARLEIEEALTARDAESPVAQTPPALLRQPSWRRLLPLAATAAIGAATAVGVTALRSEPPAPASVIRFAVELPEGQQWVGVGRNPLALSPDGTQLAYRANRNVYVRSLDALEPRLLVSATSNLSRGTNIITHAFSPDGQHLAYFDQGEAAIKRIALAGGGATSLGTLSSGVPYGLSWSGDFIFVGAGQAGILRLAAQGGSPETVARVEAGEFADAPMLLPDGDHLLFTIASGTSPDRWDKARIVVESLRSHERKTVIEGGSDGRYLASGHLTYAVAGRLYAVPFSIERLTTIGNPVPVIEGVARAASPGTSSGYAGLAVSNTGTLAYVPGPTELTGRQSAVGLFDREGRMELLKLPRGPWEQPRVSPDGARIALGAYDGKTATIWVYELSGASSMRRLTLEGQGNNRFPVWSADGEAIAFQSDREGDRGIFWQRADGTRPAERLTTAGAGEAHVPEDWAPDGQHLLYHATNAGTVTLWAYSVKEQKASRFGTVTSPELTLPGAVFSPDGRWVAYASRGVRASVVYVEPFPPTGAKYQISSDAEDGHHPAWSPDGRQLFYTPGGVTYLHAVSVATSAGFSFSDPVRLPRPFTNRIPGELSPFDVGRDGRFLGLVEGEAGTGVPPYHVVVNWFEELTRRVPVR